MNDDEMNLPSDFVANTMRNCQEMLNIIKHMNVFMNNYDKLIPFSKSLNNSFEIYTDDSMKAIKNDLIKIGLQSVNWKKEHEKIENLCKSIDKNDIINISKEHIDYIELKKPSYNQLSNESILKMIELKDIDTNEKGNSFIENKSIFKKQLKKFPKSITKFENELVLQRNSNIKNIKKITKQLLNEHRRYVKSQLEHVQLDKIKNIEYVDSQKEFIENNLKKLIKIN